MYINKTHDVINELSLALDLQKGGEVSHKLETLYQFILHQLTLANIKSDRKVLETSLNVLVPLQEAWVELFAKSQNNEISDTPIEPPPETPSRNIASQG